MAFRAHALGWFLGIALATVTASADPGMKVAPASGPANVDARTRVAFHDLIEQDIANNESSAALDGYTLFPKLLELRRYVEGDKKTATSVCVVELVLMDTAGDIVARTRAAASSESATPQETLAAAAQAATTKISLSIAAKARAERDKVARR
jgi:hypothetical protein